MQTETKSAYVSHKQAHFFGFRLLLESPLAINFVPSHFHDGEKPLRYAFWKLGVKSEFKEGHVPVSALERADKLRLFENTPNRRELKRMDLETGEGEWAVVDCEDCKGKGEWPIDGQYADMCWNCSGSGKTLLVGWEARRWWLRETAFSLLRESGNWSNDHDLWQFDMSPDLPLPGDHPHARNDQICEGIALARKNPGSRVLIVDREPTRIAERVIRHYAGPADDCYEIANRTRPSWPLPRNGWIRLISREVLVNLDKWSGDTPTNVMLLPAVSDWCRFPFPVGALVRGDEQEKTND